MKHRKYRNGAIVLFVVAVGLFMLAAMAMLFAVLSMQNLSLFSAVGKFSDIANAVMVAGGLICFVLYF